VPAPSPVPCLLTPVFVSLRCQGEEGLMVYPRQYSGFQGLDQVPQLALALRIGGKGGQGRLENNLRLPPQRLAIPVTRLTQDNHLLPGQASEQRFKGHSKVFSAVEAHLEVIEQGPVQGIRSLAGILAKATKNIPGEGFLQRQAGVFRYFSYQGNPPSGPGLQIKPWHILSDRNRLCWHRFRLASLYPGSWRLSRADRRLGAHARRGLCGRLHQALQAGNLVPVTGSLLRVSTSCTRSSRHNRDFR